jgi:hypothetical protein
MAHRKHPRSNPDTTLMDEFKPGSTFETALYTGLISVGAMGVSVLVLGRTGWSSTAQRLVAAGAMLGGGLGLRNVAKTPALGLMVGGVTIAMLPVFDSLFGTNFRAGLTAPTPTNAVFPAGAVAPPSTAVGFWEARSAFNSGKSVVVPVD